MTTTPTTKKTTPEPDAPGPAKLQPADDGRPELTAGELFSQVMLARTRVYNLFPPTPTEVYEQPEGWTMLLKREDLSEIHSYKWRGAYNFISANLAEAAKRGLVAASAGNHAQGVAVSAARLGLLAHLFMPKSAPRLKIDSVARLGGRNARIHLEGDTFDEAARAAEAMALRDNLLRVPPYDHPLVMAGQGVIGDEMMTTSPRPEVVLLQIGGGGMAAGVAAVIKTYDPSVRVVGVEAEGQASMRQAFASGKPVSLGKVDIFCDGTAVRQAGAGPYALLRGLLDDLVTVGARDVTAAMETLWRTARVLAEPSGALGLAAAVRRPELVLGKRVGVVVSGANLDFRRLADIAGKAGDPAARQLFYRVALPERPGAMLAFFKTIADIGLNISHLMVGQNDAELAYPVVGFDGAPAQFADFEATIVRSGYAFENITDRPDLPFRVAPFQPGLFKNPRAVILEFPERPGALSEFLERIKNLCNISYFNYVHTGEQVGRALAVFSFADERAMEQFDRDLEEHGPAFTPLPDETVQALGLGSLR
ncbi:MAG: pyridoxal-phosphate dependent enzyme [Deltaproteobacteria bacterium]|jgi:threonine dehydratase|nr:pyridoxal-phosphate dependent enzyme [Deltaproteobacteria bacterium]